MKKNILMMSLFGALIFAQNVHAQCSVNGNEVPCDELPVAPVIGFGVFFIFIMIVGFITFAIWLWLFIDAIRFEKENLILWLLGMFFIGPLVSIVYFFVRKRPRDKNTPNDVSSPQNANNLNNHTAKDIQDNTSDIDLTK